MQLSFTLLSLSISAFKGEIIRLGVHHVDLRGVILLLQGIDKPFFDPKVEHLEAPVSPVLVHSEESPQASSPSASPSSRGASRSPGGVCHPFSFLRVHTKFNTVDNHALFMLGTFTHSSTFQFPNICLCPLVCFSCVCVCVCVLACDALQRRRVSFNAMVWEAEYEKSMEESVAEYNKSRELDFSAATLEEPSSADVKLDVHPVMLNEVSPCPCCPPMECSVSTTPSCLFSSSREREQILKNVHAC